MAKLSEQDQVRQAVQEAIAEASNHGSRLEAITAACTVAGVIGVILFFIIDAKIDQKTSSINTEVAVIKSQFENQKRELRATLDTAKALEKKLDSILIKLLRENK